MSLAEEVHCWKYRAPEESRAKGVTLREGHKWSQQVRPSRRESSLEAHKHSQSGSLEVVFLCLAG